MEWFWSGVIIIIFAVSLGLGIMLAESVKGVFEGGE